MFDDLPYNGSSTRHDFYSRSTESANCNEGIPAFVILTRHVNGPACCARHSNVVLDPNAWVVRMDEKFAARWEIQSHGCPIRAAHAQVKINLQ
jgi:hypothetical protein